VGRIDVLMSKHYPQFLAAVSCSMKKSSCMGWLISELAVNLTSRGRRKELQEKVELEFVDTEGKPCGRARVLIDEPRFFFLDSPDAARIRPRRGMTIRVVDDHGTEDIRPIIGFSAGSGGACVLAVRQIGKLANPNEFQIFDDVALRPGSTIVGGRESGFYDSEATILRAVPAGGDPQRWEDWSYFVAGSRWDAPDFSMWITLDDVGSGTASGQTILEYAQYPETLTSPLLRGEEELIAHFARVPERLGDISPAEFERLVEAIYRNHGFQTERVGAWNQADGGIDILAVEGAGPAGLRRVAIQCKVSRHNISARPIRELAGVLEGARAHSGVVATSSFFTAQARQEVETILWKISLQDRDDIIRRLIGITRPELRKYIERYI
jgi:Holliday junction resolvase